MPIHFELLERICATPGAPGHESPIRQLVADELRPYVDALEIDPLGNLYAIKKGKRNPDGKRILLAAHLDEISFIVHHIDDRGFIRFKPLGGFDPKALTSMKVVIHGRKPVMGIMGSKPIHMMSAEERTKMPKLSDFYIDTGLPKETLQESVAVGDVVTRHQEFLRLGELVCMKSLDNRSSVFVLAEAMKRLGDCPYDVYAAFTVQEEVGIRGAQVAGHYVDPDFGLALDVTIANDTPGASPPDYITELGKGVAIKIMDRETICDVRMVRYLKEVAEEERIGWQTEILEFGGTDTKGLQRSGKRGAIAGALSIPVRYIHQTTETAHAADIDACIRLTAAAIERLDRFDWSHR
jgi:endoglucanase